MSELEEYQQQLREIDETLVDDPKNESLLALKAELLELVSLLQPDEQGKEEEKLAKKQDTQTPPDISRESITPQPIEDGKVLFAVNDVVWVKTKLEKQFKEARVINLSGNNKTVTVKFTDSNTTGAYSTDEVHREKPKDIVSKYKKQQKKTSRPKDDKYEQDLNKSAKSWQSFSKKIKKTNKDKSMFSTSTGSRVGVSSTPGSILTEKKKVKRYMPY